MKTLVFLNEQHQLLEEQTKLLNLKFDTYNIVYVPANGWALQEQKDVLKKFKFNLTETNFVFASPVPFLLAAISFQIGVGEGQSTPMGHIYVFHNDNREKKQVNGKVISVVASTGWQLVDVNRRTFKL